MTSSEQPQPRRSASLVDQLLALAEHPAGAAILISLALLEATIFPAPTEAMLIALTLARRQRAWRYASIATAASVVGALIGYQIGSSVFTEVAQPLFATYGLGNYVDAVVRVYRDNVTLALLTSGYTPIPWMLYTAVAGASDIPLGPFLAGASLGRALKYFPIVALAYLFGPAVHRLLRKVGLVALLLAVAIGIALYLSFR